MEINELHFKIADLVSKYFALVGSMKSNSSDEHFRLANELSWKISLLLPEPVMKDVIQAVHNPTKERNWATALISVRQWLLQGSAGNLTREDIIMHTPNLPVIAMDPSKRQN